MDLSVLCPAVGASGGVPAHAAPLNLSEKDAKKFFDFYKVGTARRVIFLGEVLSQKMHWVASLNYKVICTSSVGRCELCQKAPSSDDVAKADYEHLVACAVRERDGRFHQRIGVLTDGLYKGTDRYQGLTEFFDDTSPRGHAFDIARPSKHTFTVKPLRKSSWGTSSALPPAFDLLPWIRARFSLTQTPDRPLTLFTPFTIQDLGVQPTGKPRELDISASDGQSLAEVAKIKELLVAKTKAWQKEDAEATVSALKAAGLDAAVEPVAPVDPPAAAAEPAVDLPTALSGLKPGGIKQNEELKNPANFGPVEIAGYGTEDAPLITPPPPAEKVVTKDQVAKLNERRSKSRGPTGDSGPAAIGDLLPKLPALAAARNGKHEEKKGGAA